MKEVSTQAKEYVYFLNPEVVMVLREALKEWYSAYEDEYPWRRLWHQQKNPYHVWLSEIMLQQTQITTVLPYYDAFLEKFPSPNAVAFASPEELQKAVRGLGYYRRFRMFREACQKLVEQNPQGKKFQWPQTLDGWLALPGVGVYTAAAVASITANVPVGVVDGNVERVLCRMLDIRLPPNTPHLKKIYPALIEGFVCPDSPGNFNQSLMEIGQKVCRPSSPLCPECPLQEHCQAYQNKTTHLAPAPKLKKQSIPEQLKLLIGQLDDGYVLFKRPEKAKFLKNVYGFLTFRGEAGDGFSLQKSLSSQKIGSISHNITHHKITAKVELLSLSQRNLDALGVEYEKISAEAVEERLLSNLDRKAWSLHSEFLKRTARN